MFAASVPFAFLGGSIFLSPLLVLAGWADVRTASGVAASIVSWVWCWWRRS